MNSPQERSAGSGATQDESSAAASAPTGTSAPGQAPGAEPGYSPQAATGSYGSVGRHAAGYEGEPENSGAATTGIYLAGVLMILSGLLDFFAGLVGVIRRGFYHLPAHYPYNWSVHGWGWANLIGGLVILAVGSCLLLGQTWARIVAIVLVVISAVGNFLYLPFYPVWSIIVIAIDVFILWALISGWHRSAVVVERDMERVTR